MSDDALAFRASTNALEAMVSCAAASEIEKDESVSVHFDVLVGLSV